MSIVVSFSSLLIVFVFVSISAFVSSGPEVLVAFGDFIEKVGGRIM